VQPCYQWGFVFEAGWLSWLRNLNPFVSNLNGFFFILIKKIKNNNDNKMKTLAGLDGVKRPRQLL